ncbi:unnamed protein product [Echinostoma caproni]|uniref:HYLS1_C domain-containing protein n=1 Tax=Echinostoma caproni TaxID=27848 RepID=A0A183B8L7_9TREM|nr:unnamed protein product [Echinostoma caproni]
MIQTSRPRKQDPVSRYHSYQRSWLSNQIPGEDARRALRWNVKTAMMYREVPVLQRNLSEVTRLFGPRVATMLAKERQRKLKALNDGAHRIRQATHRLASHHKCIREAQAESIPD